MALLQVRAVRKGFPLTIVNAATLYTLPVAGHDCRSGTRVLLVFPTAVGQADAMAHGAHGAIKIPVVVAAAPHWPLDEGSRFHQRRACRRSLDAVRRTLA